jgi:hypothetical protein
MPTAGARRLHAGVDRSTGTESSPGAKSRLDSLGMFLRGTRIADLVVHTPFRRVMASSILRDLGLVIAVRRRRPHFLDRRAARHLRHELLTFPPCGPTTPAGCQLSFTGDRRGVLGMMPVASLSLRFGGRADSSGDERRSPQCVPGRAACVLDARPASVIHHRVLPARPVVASRRAIRRR